MASLKTKGRSGPGTTGPTPKPEHWIRRRRPCWRPIQSQLRSNQLEISNREHSIAALKTKVDDYQARLNQEPIREQQLADLDSWLRSVQGQLRRSAEKEE